jgi:hypothetical protein
MELDHVFVMCDVGAPEADALVALGLHEGSANTHPGQGTACRRFFFENAYLELVWVADPAEAQSAGVARARLWERWSARRAGVSPFGIVLRGGPDPDATHPTWPTWSYRPQWLPDDQVIEIAEGTPLVEPAIIALPFVRTRSRVGVEPLDHEVPVRQLVAASFGCTLRGSLSDAAQALQTAGLVRFESSDEPLARLTCAADREGRKPDDEVRRSVVDLRPTLPLVLEW